MNRESCLCEIHRIMNLCVMDYSRMATALDLTLETNDIQFSVSAVHFRTNATRIGTVVYFILYIRRTA